MVPDIGSGGASGLITGDYTSSRAKAANPEGGRVAVEERGLDRASFVAEKITIVLNQGHFGNINSLVGSALSWLRNGEPPPSAGKTMQVLQTLKRAGRLADFFDLIGNQELRRFLADKGVRWDFVLEHWEPGLVQSSDFFIGFALGAGESAVEGIIFLAYFLSAAPIQKAAQWAHRAGVVNAKTVEAISEERQAFFAGIATLWSEPIASMQEGIRQFERQYELAMWHLDFLQVGRIFGHVVQLLLTLPSAVKNLWKLVQSGTRLGAITFEALAKAVKSVDLEEFMQRPPPRAAFVTSTGHVLLEAGEEMAVAAADGRPLGQIAMSEVVRGLQAAGRVGAGAGKARATRRQREAGYAKKGGGLQEKYADRTPTIYPEKIWAYIEYLERKFPKLEQFKLRPVRRPRSAQPWVFEERMRTDQGNFSLKGINDIQLDDITPKGFIRDIKLGNTEEIFDEITIIDQMRRQIDFAERAGLRGVIWETTNSGWRHSLEEIILEYGFAAKENKVKVYAQFVD
jgi:hypothetical protein